MGRSPPHHHHHHRPSPAPSTLSPSPLLPPPELAHSSARVTVELELRHSPERSGGGATRLTNTRQSATRRGECWQADSRAAEPVGEQVWCHFFFLLNDRAEERGGGDVQDAPATQHARVGLEATLLERITHAERR